MEPGCSQALIRTLTEYEQFFKEKQPVQTYSESDPLLDVFKIAPSAIAQNKQYWHRHLGACWEKIVRSTCIFLPEYRASIRNGNGSPCDFAFSTFAIDTKYRLGSGDAGTLGKFAANASWLRSKGLSPMMLILRDDNLEHAVQRMKSSGWQVLTAEKSFEFIYQYSGTDLHKMLKALAYS